MTAAFTIYVFFASRKLGNQLVITTAQSAIGSSVGNEHVSEFFAYFSSNDKKFCSFDVFRDTRLVGVAKLNEDLAEVLQI